MDADGQFEGDPVLNDAYAELGTLLDKVCVVDVWIFGPLPYHVDRSKDGGEE